MANSKLRVKPNSSATALKCSSVVACSRVQRRPCFFPSITDAFDDHWYKSFQKGVWCIRVVPRITNVLLSQDPKKDFIVNDVSRLECGHSKWLTDERFHVIFDFGRFCQRLNGNFPGLKLNLKDCNLLTPSSETRVDSANLHIFGTKCL